MTHTYGAVTRTVGAAIGVLIAVLFLAEIAGRLTTSEAVGSSASSQTAAVRR